MREAAFRWLGEHGSEDDRMRRRTLRGLLGGTVSVSQEDLAEILDMYDAGVAAMALILHLSCWDRSLKNSVFPACYSAKQANAFSSDINGTCSKRT